MLEAAFVAWLVALFGDRAVQGVTRAILGKPDRRRLNEGLAAASRTAIAAIMNDVPEDSREPLRLVLAEQFSTPPKIPLDGRTHVRAGLINSIREQIAPLCDPAYTPSGTSYFEEIGVDADRISDELTHIAIRAIEQVGPAFPELMPLVNQLNADALTEQIEDLTSKEQASQQRIEELIASIERSWQSMPVRPAVASGTGPYVGGAGKLSPDAADRLVDAMLAVPSIIDDNSRNQIINRLPDPLRGGIPHSPIPRIQLYTLLQTSLDQPDGFRDLVRTIRSFERDSLPMRQLDKVIIEIGEQLASDSPGPGESGHE